MIFIDAQEDNPLNLAEGFVNRANTIPFFIDWSTIEIVSGDQMVLWQPRADINLLRAIYRVRAVSTTSYTFNLGVKSNLTQFASGISGTALSVAFSAVGDGIFTVADDEFILEVVGGAPTNGILDIQLIGINYDFTFSVP